MIEPRPLIETIDTPAIDLKICLLGLPLVTQPTGHLEIPRREVRALLYRLANRLEPISREQLCYLFWPNAPEASARRALSHLLTHLRNALPAPEIVVTCNDHIELDRRRVQTDTAAFEQSCYPAGGPHDVAALQRGLDLYRGPFLSGFALNTSAEFEAWVLQERSDWERLYLEALAVLIEEQTASGAYEAAIISAHRYLHTDELAEEVHRRLIELYAAIGNRAAAIRQFEICAAVLGRELGISPQPMTWAIYQVVLEGNSSLPQVIR